MKTEKVHFQWMIVLAFCLLLIGGFSCSCGDDDDDDSGGGGGDDDDTADDDDDDDTAPDDDDDNACTGCEIAGVCYPDGVADPDNPCLICDATADAADWSDNDGALCDDGDFCNGADICAAGACDTHAGDPCDAQCQTCDEDNDLCEDQVGSCDDDVFCNGADICDQGACSVHQGDPCNLDQACKEETDGCVDACFEDADRDGYGDPDSYETRDGDCPYGWVADKSDCDAAVFLTNPYASELPDDGIDQNCDGSYFQASEGVGVFVAATGDDGNDGTMSAPLATIQAGVDMAVLSLKKAVFVAAGTYVESVTTNTVSIFGGYDWDGEETWTRDIEANDTIVNSPSPEGIYVIPPSDRSFALVVLEGLTINGSASSATTWAVSIDNSDVSLINNTITGGSPTGTAFGIAMHSTQALLAYNTISGGSANGTNTTRGISMGYTPAILIENEITGGTSGGNHRAINAMWSPLTMIGNSIYGGTCGIIDAPSCNESIGVLSEFSPFLMEDNEISGGGSQFSSVGVYAYALNGTFIDDTIDGGTATWSRTGIITTAGSFEMKGNDISGSSALMTDSPVDAGSTATGIKAIGGVLEATDNDINGGTGVNVSIGIYTYQIYSLILLGNRIYGGNGDLSTIGVETIESDDALFVNNLIDGGVGPTSVGMWIIEGVNTILHNNITGGDGDSITSSNAIDLDTTTDNALIINNIISGGSGTDSYGIRVNDSVISTVYNNDIWNAPDCMVYYYDGSWQCADSVSEVNALTYASGNITADPQFDADGIHLTAGSTDLINAGANPVTWYTGDLADTDYDGDVRPNGAYDIGVDEYYAAD